MNTNGPTCPKCQKALPYHFALKPFNPYDFRCPHCEGRVRSRMITVQILGYAIIGVLATFPVLWFYLLCWAWTTRMFIEYLGICVPLVIVVSHFIFWKTDTLISKDDAHTSPESAGKSEARGLVSYGACFFTGLFTTQSYPLASSSIASSLPPDFTMRPSTSTCTKSGTM
jgi:hypothetical protein